MKILYVLDTQDYEVFKMSDLPESFELLRKGKKPITFKPISIQIQDMYSRLIEAEKLLKKMRFIPQHFIGSAVREYFERFKQW